MKDNFFIQSGLYTIYRPDYPDEIYNFLLSLVPSKQAAWDCGTGKGQVAKVLANHFDKVHTTDISEQQLNQGVKKENIFHAFSAAEKTLFSDNSFDLVTVAQANTLVDFKAFYNEVKRTLKHGGLSVVIAFGLLKINVDTDIIINHLNTRIIQDYRDKKRRHTDKNYPTIPFSFKELKSLQFKIEFEWTLERIYRLSQYLLCGTALYKSQPC
jgi:ubiquinone/menaquinone biosynthesis C-methylase UbiE